MPIHILERYIIISSNVLRNHFGNQSFYPENAIKFCVSFCIDSSIETKSKLNFNS